MSDGDDLDLTALDNGALVPQKPDAPLGIIACGAIARELVQLGRINRWTHFKLYCLPADLHNRPVRIPAAVAAKIAAVKRRHDSVLVGYGDCGTGGALDAVLKEAGVERLPGAHCYEFLAGTERFNALMDEEPGSFFLTDFLVRHFDRLIIRGLGLDRFPQLLDDYFGNYQRVVHLAQTGEAGLREAAARHASALNLAFEYRYTGFAPLRQALEARDLVWRAA
ncbi:MAG: DUF1638 domain-containing protein [Gammaproteobacteria bacterium]|nr:DUF1638 domain-containing protein [Gammaproteobacteria bacterium]